MGTKMESKRIGVAVLLSSLYLSAFAQLSNKRLSLGERKSGARS
jgi:hypothetical protein